MDSIGERLKRKREELKLSIEAAAEATKFRPELIREVEDGRPGLFGANVYQEGFVRTYARFLGLDGDALIRDQKSEEERAQEALRGLKPSPSARPRIRMLVLGIIAAAAIAVAVFVLVDRAGKRAGGDGGGGQAVKAGAAESTEAAGGTAATRRMRHVPTPKLQPAPAESAAAQQAPGVGLPEVSGSAVAGSVVPGSLVESGRTSGDRLFPVPAPRTEPAAAESAARDSTDSLMSDPKVSGRVFQSTPAAKPPEVTPVAQPSGQPENLSGEVPGEHTMEIVARRSVNLTVKSGDKIVLNDYWMKRGERIVYTGSGPFVIVSLSDRQAISLSLDNGAVTLPASEEHGLFNWTIRSGR